MSETKTSECNTCGERFWGDGPPDQWKCGCSPSIQEAIEDLQTALEQMCSSLECAISEAAQSIILELRQLDIGRS